MSLRLKDKVAIVTGGSSGIGRATCASLAREGAHVVAVGRSAERLAGTLELLREANEQHGTRALSLSLDVASETDMQAMAERTLEAFGRIDILVCAAGIVRPPESRLQTVAQLPLADFEVVLNTNLKGIFLSNRAVLPAMIRQGQGDIVNVSSTSGLAGLAFDGPYCASKFGVIGLSESLAEEAAPEGVRVQVLLPGPFETEIWQRTPSGLRPGNTLPPGSRVADTILYLLTLPADTRLVAPIVQPVALEVGSSVLGGSGAGKAQPSAGQPDPAGAALAPLSRLRGKVVLVTGGTSGIGRATCQAAAVEGAQVIVADAHAEHVRQVASGLPGAGHVGMTLDLGQESAHEKLVQEILARFGRIDALVTAADTGSGGESGPKPLVDTSVAEWEHVLAGNLRSVYLANRAVLPAMLKQRGGVIVNVSAEAGLKGRPNQGPYCAAKFGVLGLSQALADEVRSFGIKVQTLMPAAVPAEPAASAIVFALTQPADTTLPGMTLAPLGARRRKSTARPGA